MSTVVAKQENDLVAFLHVPVLFGVSVKYEQLAEISLAPSRGPLTSAETEISLAVPSAKKLKMDNFRIATVDCTKELQKRLSKYIGYVEEDVDPGPGIRRVRP